ncbi:MAG TPA: acyltransferase family protein [Roseomonas sp.]|jgi:peptidoglycan/LPS O-acetylase OafA/YrhL
MSYRSDIDGLRAVAVLFVVAFHAGIGPFGGGYLGVDIFLVISGFLIGSIVDRSVAAGSFSFRDFYERRVRRIAPAFLFMLFGTLLLAIQYAPPSEMAEVGRTSVAALLSLSNVYFWRNTDYFAKLAESQPLLHTWSLSVEEQFYLLMPPVVVLLYRWLPGARRPLVLAAAILSFLASILAAKNYPAASFYLLPTRAWELLLGMLVGLYQFRPLEKQLTRSMVATLGAAMIGVAVFAHTGKVPLIEPAPLLPCLGTACIIAAGRAGPTLIGRLLSARPLVLIGLMSYSIYLWHWPIIVFQRSDAFLTAEAGPAINTLVIFVASLVMGGVSWYAIERPFRSREKMGRGSVFGVVGTSAALAGAIGVFGVTSGGYAWRFPDLAREAAAYLDYDPRPQYRAGTCMISSGFGFENFRQDVCLARSAGQKHYLLLGDSHAAHLWSGLEQAVPQATIMQATASGCRPTLHAEAGAWDQCRLVVNHVLKNYLSTRPVSAVLLAAKWEEGDIPGLEQTLDWARGQGVKVILFGPIVQYRTPVPRLVANSLRTGENLLEKHRIKHLQQLDHRLRAIALARGVQYVSLWDIMCSHQNCMATTSDGRPLQFDYGHVTEEGSRLLAELIVAEAPISTENP